MIYTGYFRNIKETLYKVEIVTDNDTTAEAEEELLFTDNPVTIKYSSTDEDAYKAYKCSNATISILMKKPNFDLNNAFANRVRVTIYEEDKVFWCGYATPNAYSQEYENYLDLYELDAQDGISTLQYFKYEYSEPFGNYPTHIDNYYDEHYEDFISNHNYCTNFLHIISNLNKKLNNMYKTIYVTDNIVVEGISDISCLDAIFINESNFFDEDGESWDCLSVLEEICKYCGITCYVSGDTLYFLNQDAICRGFNNYFKYTFEDGKIIDNGKEELKHTYNIDIDSFSRNGTSISLDSVYNKVSIKDDLYSVDSLVPDIEDEEYLVESQVSNWREPNTGLEYKWDNETFTNNVKSDNTIVLRTEANGKHWVYLKHYGYDWLKDSNKKFIFKYYQKPQLINHTWYLSGMNEIQNMNTKDFTYGFTRENFGTELIEYGVCNVDSWDNLPTAPKYKKAILLHFATEEESFKLVTFTSKGIKPMFEVITDGYMMKSNSVIILKGKVTFSNLTRILPFIDNNRSETMKSAEVSFIWCKLKVGNKWLVTDVAEDGLTALSTRWQNTEGLFRLPLEYDKDTKAFNTPISFKNTIEDYMNIEEEGFAVKCPVDGENIGINSKIMFSMMIPHGAIALNNTTDVEAALLEDFDIKVCSINNEEVNSKEDNTEITNDIEERAVEEYNDINLKICTDDNKKLNLSQTFYIKGISTGSSNTFRNISFVDDDAVIYNEKITDLLRYNGKVIGLLFGNVKNIYNRAKGDVYSPEQNIISNVVEQYNSPTLNVECNLYNHLQLKPYSLLTYSSQFPKYRFCIDRISYDLGDDTTKIKMISKKYEYDN